MREKLFPAGKIRVTTHCEDHPWCSSSHSRIYLDWLMLWDACMAIRQQASCNFETSGYQPNSTLQAPSVASLRGLKVLMFPLMPAPPPPPCRIFAASQAARNLALEWPEEGLPPEGLINTSPFQYKPDQGCKTALSQQAPAVGRRC
jgi:hypothetical protein